MTVTFRARCGNSPWRVGARWVYRSANRAPFSRKPGAPASPDPERAPTRARRDDRRINHRPREDACHPPCSWTPPVGVDRPPHCRAFTKAERRVIKGQRYPADPPTVEEIIAVMHAAGDHADAVRLRGLIIVLWRAGLRISEALALNEGDLDLHRGAILGRRGKGGKRREVGMDRWAWEQLTPWLQLRATLPAGALFCALRGPTVGRAWAPAGVRSQLRHAAGRAGVRRRFTPHQLRHAHAVEMSREGVPLLAIHRQLGHADLAITSVYLRGIDNTEIVHTVHERPAPMIPATYGM
jgi:integrase